MFCIEENRTSLIKIPPRLWPIRMTGHDVDLAVDITLSNAWSSRCADRLKLSQESNFESVKPWSHHAKYVVEEPSFLEIRYGQMLSVPLFHSCALGVPMPGTTTRLEHMLVETLLCK